MSLYKSTSGREVNAHSYSGGIEFKFCRRKYQLHRIVGWVEKGKHAALELGKCLESAIQYYHENGLKPGDCVEEWKRLWLKFSDIEMTYTSQEDNWASIYRVGTDWAKLYEILLPTLPIRNPKFQLEYRKEVFAGTGLEFLSYVDMLTTAEDGSRAVVDIKSAKMSLDVEPNLLSLDPQLRRYAWITGIRDVAFLWFVKAKPNSYKKGTAVTLLEDEAGFKAGDSLVVYKTEVQQEEDGADLLQVTLSQPETIQKMEEELDKISGKGSKEAKKKIIARYFEEKLLFVVDGPSVTNTRLQYVKATIPAEDMDEIGDSIGQEMILIKDAADKGKFPKDGGVRWPNNQCTFCKYRGICLKDSNLRDQFLTQIKKADSDDWLRELETEEVE